MSTERIFAVRKSESELIKKAPKLAEKVKAGKMTFKAARIKAGLIAKPSPKLKPVTMYVSFPKRHLTAFKTFAKNGYMQPTEALTVAQPGHDADPTEYEESVNFPWKHRKAFKAFAKNNGIVWHDDVDQAPDDKTREMLAGRGD